MKNKMKIAEEKKRAGGTPIKEFREPPSLTWYIWGRKYGTTSLNIHLKACKKKWEQEQMNLPKEQRRPWPEPPKAFNEIPIQGKSCCIIYRYDLR